MKQFIITETKLSVLMNHDLLIPLASGCAHTHLNTHTHTHTAETYVHPDTWNKANKKETSYGFW